MKTRKWPSFCMAILTILCMGSCEDWGQMDPPAGNQIYPKLEQVAGFTFDEELDPTVIQPFAYSGGDTPILWDDDDRGSVLYSNDGYARTANPLNSVKVQNGVSLTFWVKQAIQTDEDTGEESDQDLEGALFSFQNGNGTQRMFFTANGWLSYEGIDGTFEDNNPASDKTGLMTAGEWHYVAMAVTNEGYFVYVDGLKKIERTITNFDCSKIVQFMASVPYLYIGYGSDSQTRNLWLDDLTIYRNTITSKEWRMKSSGGEDEEESKFIIVGNEDLTTGWWSAFSDLVKMTGNQTMHFGFYNHTNGSANWNNWLLVLTNGKNRDEAGYAEYFVLRADAYGWGNAYIGDNISHDFNFDTFTTDMQGAYVDLTIKRTDSRVDVKAIVTTTAGAIYTYTFYSEGITTTDIGAFLTCEGSYLEIDPETVYVGQSYSGETYRVGPANCTAGWWSYFSNLSVISGNTVYPFAYTFYNYTNGAANWNNWLIVVTNGKDRGEDGYAEYFVLRADAFGWGDASYTGDNISHSFNFDTFTTDMQGAYCTIILTRNGSRLDMTAKTTTAGGTKLGDYTFYHEGITTSDIGTFLTVEGASLDIRTVAYYPYLNIIK